MSAISFAPVRWRSGSAASSCRATFSTRMIMRQSRGSPRDSSSRSPPRGKSPGDAMEMTFRWYGESDAVTLSKIRQIPGVTGIVSALYDVPVGDAWSRDSLERLAAAIDAAGLRFSVVESIPVHEDIKLGRPTRDRLCDAYAESIRNMGAVGVHVLCYNFMPVFDWMRTDLAMRLRDGSTTLAFSDAALSSIDLSRGTGDLPGWAAAYSGKELAALLDAYRSVNGERL